jgi:hypothetical protein
MVAWFVVHTRRDYYRAARDRMLSVEEDLETPNGRRMEPTTALGKWGRTVGGSQINRFPCADQR